MKTTTHTDRHNRLHIVFDNESTAQPERYTIWIEGVERVVVANPWESPAAVWQRVLEQLQDMRAVIRRGLWEGRDHIYATIYAGIKPTEQQKAAHVRDHIIFCLTRLSNPAFNTDGNSRVEALIALSNILGLTPTLEISIIHHSLK